MTTEMVWHRRYPRGIPFELPTVADKTLDAVLETAFAAYADLPCFTNRGATLSFREMDELSRAFAGYLRKDLGLLPGDRVAVQLPNILPSPVAIFGVLRAGLIRPCDRANAVQFRRTDTPTEDSAERRAVMRAGHSGHARSMTPRASKLATASP